MIQIINGYLIEVSKPRLVLRDRFIQSHRPLTLNDEVCITCNNCDMRDYYCKRLHTNQKDNYDFVCDNYRRKRSGAYRRKRAKFNRGNKHE